VVVLIRSWIKNKLDNFFQALEDIGCLPDDEEESTHERTDQ
jgi:hypothetical protein